MKEFRKNEQGFFICEECQKILKTTHGLSTHIQHAHKKQHQKYFDKWLKDEQDSMCKIDNKLTKFISIHAGYKNCCCQICKNIYNQQQIEKINFIKHGFKNSFQFEISKKQIKQTKLEKYNDENYNNIEKNKRTCLKRYGVNNSRKTKEVKEKSKQTCLKRYGVEHSLQSSEVKEKSKQTCLKRYGVEYISQNTEIHEKQLKGSYYCKKFQNTNIYYRGTYELDFIDKHYEIFPDIQNGKRIKYILNNKTKYYFPDFYIPTKNLIIEIKNSWLAERDKESIKAKQKATIANGFNYIMIVDKDYSEFLNLF
jgi:hypothetical protein